MSMPSEHIRPRAQIFPRLHSDAARAGFPLILNATPAAIVTDPADFKVVQIAADLLAEDCGRVCGTRAAVHHSCSDVQNHAAVFIGTLGHSPLIDTLIQSQHLDVAAIRGQWESFLVATLSDPLPGVKHGLIIIGSDRRGTAFGVTTLAEAMGVSPWVWWADVPTRKRDTLYVLPGVHMQGPPSVKYRGLFINDEDWGLQPWAAKTCEPKETGGVGDIGPKTYARVFELMLRLRANLCWPAMHPCTQAFNLYPQNKQVADDYAIVMGSSHCEPMLRNNITEWPQDRQQDFNYFTNAQGVQAYWKQRVKDNGCFENIYTLGMRGIHDSGLEGGSIDDHVSMLKRIMSDQRAMIRELVDPDVARVPQIFCPYKEVLELYQNGAIPPEDVTLVWSDDNHGYLRQLSTPQEQQRPGGSGIYYHLSYWGRPHDYLWLSSISPALMWEELSKAYDHGARNLWIINTGDIKPTEINLTFALRLAYDISSYTLQTQSHFLRDFFAQTFGEDVADSAAAIMKQYHRLNFQRKPEHMGFNTSQDPPTPIQPTAFSDAEIAERLSAFDSLLAETAALYAHIPADARDAFYELVVYPVRGAAYLNQKLLYADLNRRAAARGDVASAAAAAHGCIEAYANIQSETDYYNNTLAGGKWKHMMCAAPRDRDVFAMPALAYADHKPAQPMPAPHRHSPPAPRQTPIRFAEVSGYVSIGAAHFSRRIDRGSAGWRVIDDLGRVGDSVAVYPTTTPSEPSAFATRAPALEYDFTLTTSTDRAAITVEAIPTHRINAQRGLRYAIAVDDQPPQIIDLDAAEFSPTWDANVLRSMASGRTHHALPAGTHVLRIFMVDPGVVLNHILIDLGGLPRTYLPPTETFTD